MADILFTTYSQQDLSLPFLLHGLGMNHIQESIHRPIGIPLYQWIQCIQGCGSLYMNDHTYTIKPGQGMFIYPNQPHSYQSKMPARDWIVNFITFSGYGIQPLLMASVLKETGVFSLSEPDSITQRLQEIYNAPTLPPAFQTAFYSSAIYNLLLHLLLHVSTSNGQNLSVQNYRIAPAITYIEEHYGEPVFLDDIAALCGLSEEYLCSLFKKTTGMRIFEYIQHIRIKHSKELLLNMPDLPAHTIGRLCGFNSSSYFNKIFKKIEHISPGDFRKQNGIGTH